MGRASHLTHTRGCRGRDRRVGLRPAEQLRRWRGRHGHADRGRAAGRRHRQPLVLGRCRHHGRPHRHVAPPGRLDRASAREVVDAAGQVVCPGFIDIQSHSIMPLFSDGRSLSKVTQGVTTEIMGEGWTPAPFGGAALADAWRASAASRRRMSERARGWTRFRDWLDDWPSAASRPTSARSSAAARCASTPRAGTWARRPPTSWRRCAASWPRRWRTAPSASLRADLPARRLPPPTRSLTDVRDGRRALRRRLHHPHALGGATSFLESLDATIELGAADRRARSRSTT